ncbi:PKD domain-containing protein [candidate division KSB1 bacterium]|nr:PKD domain-containing protein [candidate division KSB1 bacterium]
MIKKIALFIFIACIANTALANWSDPIQIATANAPDVAVDRNSGDVHILCIGSSGLLYTKCDAAGVIQSQQVVPGASGEIGGGNFGASIAVDTQGNPHIVYRVTQDGSPPFHEGYYIYKRSNGTWSAPLKLYDLTERGYILRIAMDSYDNAHIIHSEHIQDGYGQFSYTRIKNGQITNTISRFTGLYAYRTSDHAEIDVTAGGKIYVVLGCPVNDHPFQLFASMDQGNSFSHLGTVYDPEDVNEHTGSPDVFVSSDGSVHIAFGSNRDAATSFQPSVRYSKWVNDTEWINTNVTAPNECTGWGNGTDHGIGSIAASDDGQYLIAIYNKTESGQLRWRYSDDYGAHWTDPSQISAVAGGFTGRDKPRIRAYVKRFYAVYSNLNDGFTYLRIYSVPGFNPPVANAGGPYSGTEGTALTFNAGGSTDDKGIAKYEWDWGNDGTYDDQTTSATIQHVFTDNYSGTIKLRVTDVSGLIDIAEATVSVANANPIPNPGGSYSGTEGSAVSFTVTPNDPGSNDGPFTYLWNFGDTKTSTQQNPTHTYTDNKTYTVTVKVTDKDGGMGQAQTTANISNANPVPNAGGPYTGRIQQPVALTGSANDPGTDDTHTYQWDTNNDGSYDLNGQSVNAYFSSPGNHTVKLKVTDDDGGSGYATTTVTIDTESPTISQIGDQIVNEGTPFPALHLDDYVTDLDNPDNELTWSYWGNDSLIVSLQNRVVTVTVPYSEWSGFENITFQVRDPDNHTAQIVVKFQVNAVNDPPVLGNISDQFITEDDTSTIYRSTLVALVTDPDNSRNDFVFEIINSSYIHSYNDALGLNIYANPNWTGNESVTMKVSDGAGGVGTRDFKVFVQPQPDPPKPFSLLNPLNETYKVWPSSILFQWESTTDPDPGETVTYIWQLSRYNNFQTILNQSNSLSINSFTFNNSQQKTPGIYYWRVEATGSDGHKTYSKNSGQLLLDAKMPVVNPIPNQTIKEGESFKTIKLDDYVYDEDNTDAEILWQTYGNIQLGVNIDASRIATISIPAPDWYGIEQIIFEASDPLGLKDSAVVIFTVTDVNAKPVLRAHPKVTFLEDYSKTITRSTLEGLVTDEDNSGPDFSFSLVKNKIVKYTIQQNGDMLLYADPDSSGDETVFLVVDDGAGAKDSSDLKVSITPVPDPPKPFDLVSPPDAASFITWFPIMKFMWTEAVDPDPGQDVFYLWYLSKSNTFNEEEIIAQATLMDQTYYNYQATTKIYQGVYYWKVIATGYDGGTTQSNQVHTLSLITSVDGVPSGGIPKEFKLLQNHPNPFNSDTRVSYHLPENSNVTLRIYNNLGQSIRTLVEEDQVAGVYQVTWDGKNDLGQQVSSGIYIYQLKAANKVTFKKMLLIQ